ncbi:sugar kinase [Arvimicrobium flavum]|uniref:sugar kinase n=1 Tax=Arvimicrobium flavum TaxID=3393320 RepID=UPI00237BFA6B|nr:sugar kinase [Mesorhizobium shangrilense]
MANTGIASVGECMLELSGGDGGNWRMGYAGDTFNTLWTLRALVEPGMATDYVSAFGDDPFSERQIDFLKESGVGIASSPRIKGARPGLYAITLNGAERSFTYWRNDAAARQLASDPAALAASLAKRDLVYFSGITLAILEPAARRVLVSALATARRAGSLVAFDPNYRPRLWSSADDARAAFDEALAACDIALPTFPDEETLYGDADPAATAARLRSAGVPEAAVKNGEMPALVVDRSGATEVPANTVNALDTTGAGDSFNGAYLAARLRGEAPADAAKRAHRVAASVVQVRGALAPHERLREAFAAGA